MSVQGPGFDDPLPSKNGKYYPAGPMGWDKCLWVAVCLVQDDVIAVASGKPQPDPRPDGQQGWKLESALEPLNGALHAGDAKVFGQAVLQDGPDVQPTYEIRQWVQDPAQPSFHLG